MTGLVQVVGGDLDGTLIPYCGPVFHRPKPPPRGFLATLDEPAEYVVEEYDLCRWSDRSGPTQGRRYVRRDLKSPLGAI